MSNTFPMDPVPDPVSELSQRYQQLVATATDPLEITAVLESAGFNDRIAQEQYRAEDVFTLGKLLSLRKLGAENETRVMPGGSGAEDDSTREKNEPDSTGTISGRGLVLRCLRGLLYALPAFVSVTLLQAVDRTVIVLLLGGLALSWVWGSGMAYLGWVRLGHLAPDSARWELRRAMLTGIALMSVLSVIAAYIALVITPSMDVTWGTLAILIGQSVYLISAMALLVFDRDLRLMLALLPATAAGAFVVATRGVGPPRADAYAAVSGAQTVVAVPEAAVGVGAVAPAAMTATAVLALVFALRATRDRTPPAQRMSPAMLRGALLNSAFGLLATVLLVYPVVDFLLREGDEAQPLALPVALAALPLVLSMGVVEVLMYRRRRISARLLASTASPVVFARTACHAFSRLTLYYLVVLAALSGALYLTTMTFAPHYTPPVSLSLVYLLLGAATFVGMVVNQMGQTRVVLITTSVAVAALFANTLLLDDPFANDTGMVWYGIVAIALAAAHGTILYRLCRRAVNHR
ncbi:hypothetical protein AB0J57_17980 [Streptomyces sp. NPDC049837]|uniref:hypothetical protein n=1 Tax=Streptomyces sp. NPDC049837 TaxID=3155277 RepID=UPI0034185BB0